MLTTSSETVNLSSTDNLKTIIETAAVSTGTSIDASAVENVATIASSVVTEIQAVDTTSTETTTFSNLETIAYAATTLADTIEASGADINVDVAQSLQDLSLIHI